MTVAILKVRDVIPTRPDYNEEVETPIGQLGTSGRLFYSDVSSRVSEGDYLIEVVWDRQAAEVVQRGQIVAVQHVYEINHLEARRGEGGELSHYRMAVHDIDIDTAWFAQQLAVRPST